MDEFYRMTPLEVASGWVGGYDEVDEHVFEEPEIEQSGDPLIVLEALLIPALESPVCFIEFSGGRDSSAILAVAVRAARRHGLTLPVPMTRVFPAVPESREDEWQEKVLRHLGVEEWHRSEYTDEFDLLGPIACESLARHGLLWPPTIHTRNLVWKEAAGGTVVSGEGGDEILGFRRITPLTALMAGEVVSRRMAVLTALKALAPKPIRRQLIARNLRENGDRSWLHPDAQREFLSMQIQDRVSEPLWWDDATRRHRHRRADHLGLHNLRLSARIAGAAYLAPLHTPIFLETLARRGGRMGFAGRAAAMREVFGDLLPQELLERKTKAEFGGSFIGEYARDFMSKWEGDGLDDRLVDAAVLKREWAGARPHAGTMPLLHAAWLMQRSH